ncbi:MFS transporter [Streptomyces alboflavus]|uniref:MFS transporter n=1 Tax=Streptomyces alboflavus TaxID=67267 RepID=A0A1Z1WP16_9ACTN|nr:MFS transporter [Streptomyces alboflavus]
MEKDGGRTLEDTAGGDGKLMAAVDAIAKRLLAEDLAHGLALDRGQPGRPAAKTLA